MEEVLLSILISIIGTCLGLWLDVVKVGPYRVLQFSRTFLLRKTTCHLVN